MQKTPYGYCHCGCGEKTRLAPRTHAHKGWVKGEPLKYILDHWGRAHRLGYAVDAKTGCWNALGRDNNRGYVQIRRGGRSIYAHRWYYEQLVGPVPEGRELDHLCRNRRCVNPAHLEPVTAKQNSNRGLRTKLTDVQVAAIRASAEARDELAARYGISRGYVNQILNGRARPSQP